MKKAILALVPFVKYILFIWIATGGCCNLYFFDIAFYIRDKLFMVAYFVFCLVFGFMVSRNRELRKSEWGSIFINTIVIETYFVTLFAQYHFWGTVILVLVLTLVHCLIYLAILNFNEHNKDSHSMSRKYKERAARIICCVAAVVLIIPSAIGCYEEYFKAELTAEEWSALTEISEEDINGEKEQTLFEKHKETFSEIEKWSLLDDESKVELIYKIAFIELENLGVGKDAGIRVTTEKIDKFTMGYYMDSEKLIVINIAHICSDDIAENIDTVAHETFHAYQHYVVSSVDFNSDFVKTSKYYSDAREWKENINNYISASSDFSAYQAQPLEADASEYASERVEEYMLELSHNTI